MRPTRPDAHPLPPIADRRAPIPADRPHPHPLCHGTNISATAQKYVRSVP